MARRFEMKQQAAAEAAAAAAAAMALPSQNQASTRGASPLHRRTSVGSGGPPLSLATSASIARVEPERAALLRDVQNLELLVDLCETAPSLRHDEAAAIAAHGPSGVTTGPVADLLRRRLSAGRGVGVAALSELQVRCSRLGMSIRWGHHGRMTLWHAAGLGINWCRPRSGCCGAHGRVGLLATTPRPSISSQASHRYAPIREAARGAAVMARGGDRVQAAATAPADAATSGCICCATCFSRHFC